MADVIVSTCCGAALTTGTEVRATMYYVCSACRQPNDGETIPQRDARIAESVREKAARVAGPAAVEWVIENCGYIGSPDQTDCEEHVAAEIKALDLSDAGRE